MWLSSDEVKCLLSRICNMYLLFYFPLNAWSRSVVVTWRLIVQTPMCSEYRRRDPQAACSEKEEIIWFLHLLSLRFIYFLKNQQ